MDIRKVITGTITLLAIIVFQHADAAGDAAQGLVNHFERVEYDQTSVGPDSVAYLRLMQQLANAENNNAHAANVRQIANHLSLDKEHSELFLQYMLSSYAQIKSTDRAMMSQLLCRSDGASYKADDAHRLVNAADSLQAANLNKYFRRAHANLGSRVAKRLDDWLADIELQTADKDAGTGEPSVQGDETPEQFIDRTCNLVAEY